MDHLQNFEYLPMLGGTGSELKNLKQSSTCVTSVKETNKNFAREMTEPDRFERANRTQKPLVGRTSKIDIKKKNVGHADSVSCSQVHLPRPNPGWA
mmetsp:Transcript_24949/g.29336  ORF Transcript_24949/g.29336 Transcript_24949/m.29336 type:complete len:96 (+) Transcript_24949:153-440(+)